MQCSHFRLRETNVTRAGTALECLPASPREPSTGAGQSRCALVRSNSRARLALLKVWTHARAPMTARAHPAAAAWPPVAFPGPLMPNPGRRLAHRRIELLWIKELSYLRAELVKLSQQFGYQTVAGSHGIAQ